MEKLVKWAMFGAFALSCTAGSSMADGDSIGVDFTADFMSKYVWRGQNLNNNFVFQPGVEITFGNFTAGIWGSQELSNYNGEAGNFTEFNYSLDYTNIFPGFEKLSYSVGIIYYDFPNTNAKDTTEVYWGLSYDCFLNPSVMVYHDIDEAKGTYVSFGISHAIDEIFSIGSTPVGVELGASVGYGSASYNKYYWGPNQAKVNDLTMSVSFPVELGSWTFAPSLNYVTLLSNDIRSQDTYRQESDYFFVGFSIGKSF